ncbi:hypothetical protein Tco_0344571 [Tanacetum coccineum]
MLMTQPTIPFLGSLCRPSLTEEFVVTADETKSLDVSESVGAQENQNETAKAEKVLNTIVEENVEEKKKAEDHSSDILTIEQLLDEVDKQNSDVTKDAEVTFMGSEPMDMDSQTIDSEFELESMPDDDLQSLSGFETSVSDSSHDVSYSEHTSWEKTTFAEFQSLSGHLDHVCEEVSLLHYKVKEMEYSIAQKVSDDINPLLPQLLKESLTPFIPSESVAKEQAQLNKQVVKHMNRQFNIAHKAESLQFEVRRTLEAVVIVDDHAEGEKSKEGQMAENANPATTQGEHSNVEENVAILDTSQGEHKSDNANISSANEETTLVIHQTANLKTTKDDTDYDELDKDPLSKKFKIMTPIPNFPTLTPFFSPAPLKEPSPPRDPAKGKGVNIEEPVNVLVPFMDEGESNPKMSSLKPFMNIEGVSTQEEFIKKLAEIKRLADLRAQKEESKKALKKLLNPATVKAQVLKWKEHEEKRLSCLKSMFQWVLNQAKNLGLPPPPTLATFGMTADDKKWKRNETLKEEGMVIREPEARLLNHINLDSPEAREMYKIMEIKIESRDDVNKAKEIVRTNSDGLGTDCWANLEPNDLGLDLTEIRLSVKEPLSILLRGIEDQLSAKHQLAVKGLSECRALESNIKRIQVKYIVKKIKDYLKTYSSTGMDISWEIHDLNFRGSSCKNLFVLSSPNRGRFVGFTDLMRQKSNRMKHKD